LKKVIAIDMDGVICKEERTFDRPLATPIPGAIESVNKIHAAGHTVIIWTARGWEQFRSTQDWLERHGVSYDVLLMGKPIVDVFVDDRAVRFESWPIDVTKYF
jgi:ribonucleotide monophosphatase NagD (HAD superfamily)